MITNMEATDSLRAENALLRQKVVQLTQLVRAAAKQRNRLETMRRIRDMEPQILHAILDNTNIGVGLLDTSGYYIKVNARWCDMFGYTAEEMDQITYLNTSHLDDTNEDTHLLQALACGEIEGYCQERLFLRKDKSTFVGQMSVRAISNSHGEIGAIITLVTDITEHKRSREALQESNLQLEYLVKELRQHNREIILLNAMSDLLQRCTKSDDAYTVLEQFADYLFAGQKGALYIIDQATNRARAVASWGNPSSAHTDTLLPDQCLALQRETLHRADNPRTASCCPHLRVGARFPHMCIPIVTKDEKFGVLHLASGPTAPPQAADHWERLAVMVAEHLTLTLSNLRLRERLDIQATHDALTGLFNRRYLNRILEDGLFAGTIGVVMLDVDHFKQFNTEYGHSGGDAVLNALGAFLKSKIRDNDIACRYGGEEFMIILNGASLADTCRRAQELLVGIKRLEVQHNGQVLRSITVSMGVANLPQHGKTTWEVIEAADIALNSAKQQGRDRVFVAELPPPLS